MTSEPLHSDPTGAEAPAAADEQWSGERIAQSISRIHAMALAMDVHLPTLPVHEEGFPGSDAW